MQAVFLRRFFKNCAVAPLRLRSAWNGLAKAPLQWYTFRDCRHSTKNIAVTVFRTFFSVLFSTQYAHTPKRPTENLTSALTLVDLKTFKHQTNKNQTRFVLFTLSPHFLFSVCMCA
jgi:hypothetical protein